MAFNPNYPSVEDLRSKAKKKESQSLHLSIWTVAAMKM